MIRDIRCVLGVLKCQLSTKIVLTDCADVKDDGKQQVLGEEWEAGGGGWKQVGDKYLEEDDQGEKDGDSHGRLLAGIDRK